MPDETKTAILEAPPEKAATTEPEKQNVEVGGFEKAMQVFGDTMTYGLGKTKKKAKSEESPAEKPNETSPKQEEQKDDKVLAKDKVEEPGSEEGSQEAAKHKPKPKTKAVAKQPLDETRLAEIAADAGARASAETITRIENERKKPEQAREESFTPPKEYADQYATFKVMAKAKPDKYGNLVGNFKEFVKEEENYIKDWKRSHPGEQWDGEADEHNSFYERATPTYDDKDFRKAEMAEEIGDAKKELRKEVMDEVEPRLKKLDAMEQAEAIRALQPAVESVARATVSSVLKAINPDYDKYTDPDKIDKLQEEDPIAYDIVRTVAADALPFVTEVTKLWKNSAVKAQPGNQVHQYIFNYADKMGDLIKQLPSEDQIRDGKPFSTWGELAQRTEDLYESKGGVFYWDEKDNQKKPTDKNLYNSCSYKEGSKCWVLSDRDLIERKMLDAQEIAKERFIAENKKLETWARRKGMSNGNAQNHAPKDASANGEKETKPLPAKDNNGSPSVGSRTQVSPNAEPAPAAQAAHMRDFGTLFNGLKL